MKILVAGLVKSSQFERLKEEGEKRGHVVDGCYSHDLVISASVDGFKPTLVSSDLSSYNLIYMIVGKKRWEWYTAGLYLKEKYGTIIVNQKYVDPTYNLYYTPAIDYLNQVKNNLPFPASVVFFSPDKIDSFLSKFSFPLIVKGSGGRKGRGVFLVNERKGIIKALSELPQESSFVVREFIPNDGDIRIFTVGYKAIGAMKRVPAEGEFRSNISQGGHGEPFDLRENPEIRDIAEKASRVMQVEVAGVDIIIHKNTGRPYILEINPAPQFEGLEKYTGVNAAEEIVKYFEELYNTHK